MRRRNESAEGAHPALVRRYLVILLAGDASCVTFQPSLLLSVTGAREVLGTQDDSSDRPSVVERHNDIIASVA